MPKIDFYARCEVCKQDIFARDRVVSYGIKDRNPYKVELGPTSGPWCGVRCVCIPCVRFLVGLVVTEGTTVQVRHSPGCPPEATGCPVASDQKEG